MRRCLRQYAAGQVDRWCDRSKGHAGPCSGSATPRASRLARETTPRADGWETSGRDAYGLAAPQPGGSVLRWTEGA